MTSGFGDSGQNLVISTSFPSSFGVPCTSIYNQITSIPRDTPSVILSYTVPAGKTFFVQLVEVGGDNVAHFTVEVGASVAATARTWFNGPFIEHIRFDGTGNAGLSLIAGVQIKVKVVHHRPVSGTFEGRIVGVLI